MEKILADKYYLILIIIVAYLLFNVTLRDPLINWIYHTNPDKSVQDANAYANAIKLRDLFSYLLFVCLVFISIASIVLLTIPEGKILNKWILITVPVLIAILFFCIMAIGGFS